MDFKQTDFDFIDKIIFINLEKRIDRLQHMNNILKFINKKKIVRFNAIEHWYGHIGCTKSHIACLEMAKKNNWKNVLILEDDFTWNNYDKSINIFKNILQQHPNFDVITLGNTYADFDPITYKLFSGQTTTAYLVNNHYYDKLKQNFEEGLIGLEIITRNMVYSQRASIEEQNCVDQYWKLLQKIDNWYIVNPALGIQMPSKSTISGITVNYTELFNT